MLRSSKYAYECTWNLHTCQHWCTCWHWLCFKIAYMSKGTYACTWDNTNNFHAWKSCLCELAQNCNYMKMHICKDLYSCLELHVCEFIHMYWHGIFLGYCICITKHKHTIMYLLSVLVSVSKCAYAQICDQTTILHMCQMLTYANMWLSLELEPIKMCISVYMWNHAKNLPMCEYVHMYLDFTKSRNCMSPNMYICVNMWSCFKLVYVSTCLCDDIGPLS